MIQRWPFVSAQDAGPRYDKGNPGIIDFYNSQVSIPIVLFPWISHERSYMSRHTISIIVELRFLPDVYLIALQWKCL